MAAHEHSVTCPACGGAINAATQDELIRMVQDHAKKDHQMDLSAEKVLEMEKAQAKK